MKIARLSHQASVGADALNKQAILDMVEVRPAGFSILDVAKAAFLIK